MDKPLKQALINYFIELEKMKAKWDEFHANVERSLQTLKNQSEQLRHVNSPEVDKAEVCEIDGVREKLVFKICTGMELEIAEILSKLRGVKNHVEVLKAKYNCVDEERCKVSCHDPDLQELVDGTPQIPELDTLLEWGIESVVFYSVFCSQIFLHAKRLDYKDEESLNEWLQKFVPEEGKPEKMEKILGFTQFLVKQTV